MQVGYVLILDAVDNSSRLEECTDDLGFRGLEFLKSTPEGAAYMAAQSAYARVSLLSKQLVLQPNAASSNYVSGTDYSGIRHGIAVVGVHANGAVLCSCRHHHASGTRIEVCAMLMCCKVALVSI